MMPKWEAPIGNSGQMVSGHYHSGTECQFGIELQPLSRFARLRLQQLRRERSLQQKLISLEIGFPRAERNRQTVERVSANDEMCRLRLNGSCGILVQTYGRGRK